MGDPFTESAQGLDLSPRLVDGTAVIASPALAAETVIASTEVGGGLSYATGVRLSGWAAFTVGTSGTAVRLRIRRGGISGAVVADSGALSATAATVVERSCRGVDTTPGDSPVYVLTLQVTAGAAQSTVTAVDVSATAI